MYLSIGEFVLMFEILLIRQQPFLIGSLDPLISVDRKHIEMPRDRTFAYQTKEKMGFGSREFYVFQNKGRKHLKISN